ncbi:MAG: WecB/TagA/CpsF family glycosyltransferase [Thermodesulfobacteriota bacterium]|nr:WecB/TagA/CpsF family glycosyltransferase [Thermodesulfobacteriota bacterium]
MRQNTLFDFLGYPISHSGLNGDVTQALKLINSGAKGAYMACANPHSLVTALKDDIFREALLQADILVPDGIGIVISAKLLGLPIRERVAGSEFFNRLSEKAQQRGGIRYFFLGSTPDTLSLLADRLNRDFPDIYLCGVYSPPFKPVFSEQDNIKMIQAVNAAKPDVLWVGMTAPKQEKWIYENRHRLEVPLSAAVGAVFDFYAGTKQRSSGLWISLGLEWLPRLLREPRRLWERNLKSTPVFMGLIAKEKLKAKSLKG